MRTACLHNPLDAILLVHSDEEFAAVMLSALPHMKATPVPMLPLGVRRAAQKKLTRAS